jgi:DNA-binding MarR family transcriptional regulator
MDRSKNFLRFLELVNSVRDLNKLPFMDPLEERMLLTLVKFWSKGVDLTTLEAMNQQKEMSVATANRKLKSLSKKSLIRYETDSKDRRIKLIKPTENTSAYFGILNECLIKAAKLEA